MTAPDRTYDASVSTVAPAGSPPSSPASTPPSSSASRCSSPRPLGLDPAGRQLVRDHRRARRHRAHRGRRRADPRSGAGAARSSATSPRPGSRSPGFGAARLAATGLEIVRRPSAATPLGFFIWMIGSWLIATRFALRPFTYTRPVPRQAPPRVVERPVPDARPLTGLRKHPPARRRSLRRPPGRGPLPTPRIVYPTPPARAPAARPATRPSTRSRRRPPDAPVRARRRSVTERRRLVESTSSSVLSGT